MVVETGGDLRLDLFPAVKSGFDEITYSRFGCSGKPMPASAVAKSCGLR